MPVAGLQPPEPAERQATVSKLELSIRREELLEATRLSAAALEAEDERRLPAFLAAVGGLVVPWAVVVHQCGWWESAAFSAAAAAVAAWAARQQFVNALKEYSFGKVLDEDDKFETEFIFLLPTYLGVVVTLWVSQRGWAALAAALAAYVSGTVVSTVLFGWFCSGRGSGRGSALARLLREVRRYNGEVDAARRAADLETASAATFGASARALLERRRSALLARAAVAGTDLRNQRRLRRVGGSGNRDPELVLGQMMVALTEADAVLDASEEAVEPAFGPELRRRKEAAPVEEVQSLPTVDAFPTDSLSRVEANAENRGGTW